MGEIVLELPRPPSANHRYVRRRDGRLALTTEARDYDVVVYAALGPRRPQVPRGAPVSIRVDLAVDHWRRRDLDNVLKQLIDSLARVLGFDDADVVRIEATKRLERGNEGVVVVLSWGGGNAGR